MCATNQRGRNKTFSSGEMQGQDIEGKRGEVFFLFPFFLFFASSVGKGLLNAKKKVECAGQDA